MILLANYFLWEKETNLKHFLVAQWSDGLLVLPKMGFRWHKTSGIINSPTVSIYPRAGPIAARTHIETGKYPSRAAR